MDCAASATFPRGCVRQLMALMWWVWLKPSKTPLERSSLQLFWSSATQLSNSVTSATSGGSSHGLDQCHLKRSKKIQMTWRGLTWEFLPLTNVHICCPKGWIWRPNAQTFLIQWSNCVYFCIFFWTFFRGFNHVSLQSYPDVGKWPQWDESM